jgi:hypothetical protein
MDQTIEELIRTLATAVVAHDWITVIMICTGIVYYRLGPIIAQYVDDRRQRRQIEDDLEVSRIRRRDQIEAEQEQLLLEAARSHIRTTQNDKSGET